MRATLCVNDGALRRLAALALATALLGAAAAARAEVLGDYQGGASADFALVASAGHVSTPDGASIYSWGYGLGPAMQYPGPTLIVDEGACVTITLRNALPVAAGNASLVLQGHDERYQGAAQSGCAPAAAGAVATDGVSGLIAREAAPGGSVTYRFLASRPGTYLYGSGTRPDLQVEMGLVGSLIVRPSGRASCAFANDATCFDRENLYVLSEMDLDIHRAVEEQAGGPGPIEVATSPYDPEYWFINGRCAPDTMAEAGTAVLANQPYNAITRMYPGERVLLRIVGAGRQMHPFHTHGNHSRLLARDGRLMADASGNLMGPLLFTVSSIPGGTADALFDWTGKDLGWDIYGVPHVNGPDTCSDGNGDGYDDATHEWCSDHGRRIPVQLPELQQMTFGGFWSGSPYLGVLGSLPPGEGGLNPSAGYTYMWHSHSEREIVNNDIFPGGMMTMLVIEARP